jgi:hypothetical protein
MTVEPPANSIAQYGESRTERRIAVFLVEADLERLKAGETVDVRTEQLPDFDPDDKAVTVTVQRFGA